MFFLYSLIYTLAFIVLSPRFLWDVITGGKYAAGFKQRLGFLPAFEKDQRSVVWLHCVSVGEANAARPLVDEFRHRFPTHRLIVSTVTRTGQKHVRDIFKHSADAIFYFPFDWKFSVKRAIKHYEPNAVILMETEIWPNFIREANHSGAKVCIANGRLSEKSYKRYSYFKKSMKRILGYFAVAAMQSNADAKRIMALGMRASKVRVSGNLKFDHSVEAAENQLTEVFRERFAITPEAPLIIAASTHEKEEAWLLDVFKEIWKSGGDRLPRLMIVPRHPERFDTVTDLLRKTGFDFVKRSESESSRDKTAEVILLDSIGELRAAYPLAEIVFVGGSLIPHGGQSIFEPAACGKAIVTGPYTDNFKAAIADFAERKALIQVTATKEKAMIDELTQALQKLVHDQGKRITLGSAALSAMKANRGATSHTLEYLEPYLGQSTFK
ncbi:MAG: 3-deoxy-D-manno-octulosonic acid transferase [Blastocatellia bacterium]|nr:3-deoxy-D-manno-octulosonic acid transferase [Blastocatellia bacterium]